MAHPGHSLAEYVRDPGFQRTVISSAVSGAVGGLVGLALAPATFLGTVAAGAISGAASSAATQITQNVLTPCAEWHEDLLGATIAGGVAGGITAGLFYGLRQWLWDGTQSIGDLVDWDSYPQNPRVPKPSGPFRLLEGEEYEQARAAADAANRAMHRADPGLKGLEIHEIKPVKWGGSPTDPANKVALPPGVHDLFTNWWNAQQRAIEQVLGILQQ